jgi:hypothetical protein
MSEQATWFRIGHFHGRGYEQIERQRLADLQRPFPGNPPELLAPTRCRVLKRFGIGGGRVGEPGQEITLARHDAESMEALKRVELL